MTDQELSELQNSYTKEALANMIMTIFGNASLNLRQAYIVNSLMTSRMSSNSLITLSNK